MRGAKLEISIKNRAETVITFAVEVSGGAVCNANKAYMYPTDDKRIGCGAHCSSRNTFTAVQEGPKRELLAPFSLTTLMWHLNQCSAGNVLIHSVHGWYISDFKRKMDVVCILGPNDSVAGRKTGNIDQKSC